VRFQLDAGEVPPVEARGLLHWLGAADGLSGTRTAQAELRFWAQWSARPAGADTSPAGRDSGPDAALAAVGLAEHARTEVRRLSTGQRRRLALARLLAPPRPLWLLDEPLAPLDAAWRGRVGQLMQAHLDRGGLLIAAVHDPLPVPARELRLEAA
jgi:heme exporter protein A